MRLCGLYGVKEEAATSCGQATSNEHAPATVSLANKLDGGKRRVRVEQLTGSPGELRAGSRLVLVHKPERNHQRTLQCEILRGLTRTPVAFEARLGREQVVQPLSDASEMPRNPPVDIRQVTGAEMATNPGREENPIGRGAALGRGEPSEFRGRLDPTSPSIVPHPAELGDKA